MDSELYALGEQVGAALKNTKLVLTTAESCTGGWIGEVVTMICLLYTSPSPRDRQKSRMPSSA